MLEKLKAPTKKRWFLCPRCGKRLVLYHDAAKCCGVYVWCKGCKRDIEIIIE